MHEELLVNFNLNFCINFLFNHLYRKEPESCIYDLAVFNNTEKKSITGESTNTSTNNAGDQFCLYRRKKKPTIIGEDKFNELSDEIILMILKWLPKKCLVRIKA